jgi:hypothetical protein
MDSNVCCRVETVHPNAFVPQLKPHLKPAGNACAVCASICNGTGELSAIYFFHFLFFFFFFFQNLFFFPAKLVVAFAVSCCHCQKKTDNKFIEQASHTTRTDSRRLHQLLR